MNIKLENRQIAVYTALLLAVIMLFLPGTDRNRYSFKPGELAASILAGEDQVSAADLADWIIQGRSDLLIVDIRSEADFEKGSIKSSLNIPLAKLLERSTIDTELPESKTVVLYSNGDSHSHQAWLILKAAGVNAYVLQGGFNRWTEVVLNPGSPADSSDDEVLKYEAAKSVAGAFGSTGSVLESKGNVKSNNASIIPPVKSGTPPKKKKLASCG